MNDDLTPLEPDLLDEFLSAQLDGEFAAAARDLGLDADVASARLRATPGADERRAALASARELLSEPPEIDELVAARLLAKAVRALEQSHTTKRDLRRQRRTRIMLGASGIAAAVLAVVAVAAGMSSQSSSSKASSAPSDTPLDAEHAPRKPGSSSTTVAPRTPGLGAFTDLHALALVAVAKSTSVPTGAGAATDVPAALQQLQNDMGKDSSASPATANAKSSTGSSAPLTTERAGVRDNESYGVAAPKLADGTCSVPSQVPGGSTLLSRATATLSGRPVVVLVFAGSGEHIVTIQNAACELVNIQFFG